VKEGAKPILFHTIHTAVVFYCMVVALFLGPCLGDVDDVEKYTLFYRYSEYTLLYEFYSWPMIIFILLVAYLCTLHPIPYGVMYWIKYRYNPGPANTKKGIVLTAITLLLIIVHPLGTINYSDMIYYFELDPEISNLINALLTYFIMLVTIYLMPYLFVSISYPQLINHRLYKSYSVFLISQLIINLFLIAFSMGAFPELQEAFKNIIDSKYSRW